MAERIRNLQPGEASYSNSLKRPTSSFIAFSCLALRHYTTVVALIYTRPLDAVGK